MATSTLSAMESSLAVVVVLLLSAVVASQAHQVSCKNTWEKTVPFNGIWTGVGVTTVLEVKSVIVVEVYDGKGVKHVGKFKCLDDVKALEFVSEGGGFVKAQITDFSGPGSTLHSRRRTLRGSVKLDIPIDGGQGGRPGVRKMAARIVPSGLKSIPTAAEEELEEAGDAARDVLGVAEEEEEAAKTAKAKAATVVELTV